MTLEGLITLFVYVLLALVVAGVLTWIIRSAPATLIPATWRDFICWGIWVVVALILLIILVRHMGMTGSTRLW